MDWTSMNCSDRDKMKKINIDKEPKNDKWLRQNGSKIQKNVEKQKS